MNRNKLFLFILLLTCTLFALDKEGGYYGTTNEGHEQVVRNFLNRFNTYNASGQLISIGYEQCLAAKNNHFIHDNNSFVDAMHIAIFAGHGNNWLIQTTDGVVDLSTAGNTGALGYGNVNLKFIAFESCKVIPSPLEVSDWSTKWVQPGGIFDGLHQAVGFRTNSYQNTDQDIAAEFGNQVKAGKGIWQAWFDAIDKKGYRQWSWSQWKNVLKEYGSAVMYPDCDGETYYSLKANPPANSWSLKIWYQK